jgi:hypothetical protein
LVYFSIDRNRKDSVAAECVFPYLDLEFSWEAEQWWSLLVRVEAVAVH